MDIFVFILHEVGPPHLSVNGSSLGSSSCGENLESEEEAGGGAGRCRVSEDLLVERRQGRCREGEDSHPELDSWANDSMLGIWSGVER